MALYVTFGHDQHVGSPGLSLEYDPVVPPESYRSSPQKLVVAFEIFTCAIDFTEVNKQSDKKIRDKK